jgi:hypothetical protein
MKFVISLMMIFSLSAIAGDSYLVCADLANDEEWIVDLYFDNESSILSTKFLDEDRNGHQIHISFNPQSYEFKAINIDEFGNKISSLVTILDWFEYQAVTNRYACKITD